MKSLIELLNDQQYHSGDELGAKLKITRSAIWKLTKNLSKYNVKIESIKGKGYRLISPLILLDNKKIKKYISNKCDIEIFESTISTNDFLKNDFIELTEASVKSVLELINGSRAFFREINPRKRTLCEFSRSGRSRNASSACPLSS